MTMTTSAEVDLHLNGKPLDDNQKKLKGKRIQRRSLLNNTTPEIELGKLVLEHKALGVMQGKLVNSASPHTLKTGERVPSQFDASTCLELTSCADALDKRAKGLEKLMLLELREMPIYQHFLKKVWGCGTMTAAYLAASINVVVKEQNGATTKPSALVRYCGLSVDDGSIARLTAGKTRDFNPVLRERLFIMFTSMSKLRGGTKSSNKYLDVWDAKKAQMLASSRVVTSADGKPQIDGHPAKSFANSAGWHVAARVFLEDLYIIWRTLLGQPVWPSFTAGKLGYAHGGKIVVNAPKQLTLEEAIELVGDVGSH